MLANSNTLVKITNAGMLPAVVHVKENIMHPISHPIHILLLISVGRLFGSTVLSISYYNKMSQHQASIKNTKPTKPTTCENLF